MIQLVPETVRIHCRETGDLVSETVGGILLALTYRLKRLKTLPIHAYDLARSLHVRLFGGYLLDAKEGGGHPRLLT